MNLISYNTITRNYKRLIAYIHDNIANENEALIIMKYDVRKSIISLSYKYILSFSNEIYYIMPSTILTRRLLRNFMDLTCLMITK